MELEEAVILFFFLSVTLKYCRQLYYSYRFSWKILFLPPDYF